MNKILDYVPLLSNFVSQNETERSRRTHTWSTNLDYDYITIRKTYTFNSEDQAVDFLQLVGSNMATPSMTVTFEQVPDQPAVEATIVMDTQKPIVDVAVALMSESDEFAASISKSAQAHTA